MEFSKTNEYTKFLQNTCLLLRLYDQSDEFNVIGQQVSYCPALVQHAIYIALEQHNARGPALVASIYIL